MIRGDKVWRVFVQNTEYYTTTKEEVDRVFSDMFTLLNRNNAYRLGDLMFYYREKIFLTQLEAEYWVKKQKLLNGINLKAETLNAASLIKVTSFIENME